MSDKADERIAELERENRGLQEMLFQVLTEVGEPVVVRKETLQEGIVGDKMIDISLNEEEEVFVFRVVDLAVE